MAEERRAAGDGPSPITAGGVPHHEQPRSSAISDPQSPPITSDSPLWRLFLDSSCSSASVFLRVQLATAQSYFHSPTPWSPGGSGHVSRKVARLLDSFRPGSTSYCPFPGKNFEPDSNNNNNNRNNNNNNNNNQNSPPQAQPPAQPPSYPLLRPSEVPSQPIAIPQPPQPGPTTPQASTQSAEGSPSSTTPSLPLTASASSVSREEEARRQLYLPLGRPRPFYPVSFFPDRNMPQEEGRGALEEQRLPTLQNARSLQDEVRAHLVQRLGLVNLEKLLRNGEHGFALPSFVKNSLLTFPCSDFNEEGCASLRSSASYSVRCRLDNRQYLAVFATSEVDKSASNLWEEQRAWLLGLDTQLIRHVLALAVDPLTENIFYILDVDRGENLSSLVSRLNPSTTKVQLGDGLERSFSEAADMIEEGITRALADLTRAGLSYPGLRQDRVWVQDGQVLLENGLLVKGSPATPVDQSSLTDVLRDHAKDQQLNQRETREAETE